MLGSIHDAFRDVCRLGVFEAKMALACLSVKLEYVLKTPPGVTDNNH